MDAEQAAQLQARVEAYRRKRDEYTRAADELDRRGQRVGNLRGLCFLAALGVLVLYWAGDAPWLVFPLVGLCLGFVGLVKHHSSVIEREEDQRRLALVSDHGLLRLTHKWQTLPRTGVNFAPADHPYASDLDVFGNGSLYQRICVAHTRFGQSTLAHYLSTIADAATIAERQDAVRRLAAEPEFRAEFEASGMALVDKGRGKETRTLTDGPNPARLLGWAKTREPLLENPVLLGLAYVFPLVSIAGMLAQGLLDWPPYVWIASMGASMLLLSIARGPTNDAFAAASTTEGAFLRYGELLRLLEKHQADEAWFQKRRRQLLGQGGTLPSAVMARFRTIVSWYDFRHSGMAYPFFNALLLWDIHCSAALHRWKTRSGADLETWFAVIGEYEALSSLAALLADDPAATMPSVAVDPDCALSATELGHPLLAPPSRVVNDVAPLLPGEALLVTGSNMSGKSTFLRALGVNCVLAFSGGPVIARKMALPIVRIGTSIRVSDSLASGVSHFYAEVQKLAHVVELARSGRAPVLFLLDEILHGTNSRERQIGARWVLAELLRLRAFGVITTHDMELCRLPDELMTPVRQHHFRELVKDGEMTFDYTLRPGPVTSGNALRLMRKVGLEVPLEE